MPTGCSLTTPGLIQPPHLQIQNGGPERQWPAGVTQQVVMAIFFSEQTCSIQERTKGKHHSENNCRCWIVGNIKCWVAELIVYCIFWDVFVIVDIPETS